MNWRTGKPADDQDIVAVPHGHSPEIIKGSDYNPIHHCGYVAIPEWKEILQCGCVVNLVSKRLVKKGSCGYRHEITFFENLAEIRQLITYRPDGPTAIAGTNEKQCNKCYGNGTYWTGTDTHNGHREQCGFCSMIGTILVDEDGYIVKIADKEKE